ncbi:hypothetical protein [Intrasporangium sp.]|jgi:hypothetical protein|uniref:hypothetical protein n=1 Tax=Intrasporangium sp. TaxID=1925024 RepID=UPI00336532F3
MTTVTEQSSDTERRTIYIVACVVVVALLVVALFSYRSKESTEQANQKANQLIAALTAAGAATPQKDMIVRTLGDDGGAVCKDPNGALSRATLLGSLMNGAGGPGMRPIIADNRMVKGAVLIIQVYCPDELPSFQEFVDSLNFDNTIRG